MSEINSTSQLRCDAIVLHFCYNFRKRRLPTFLFTVGGCLTELSDSRYHELTVSSFDWQKRVPFKLLKMSRQTFCESVVYSHGKYQRLMTNCVD